MAVPKPEAVNAELSRGSTQMAKVIQKEEELRKQLGGPSFPDKAGHKLSAVEKKAAELYTAGYSRTDTARALVDHIFPPTGKYRRWPLTKRLKQARMKIRRWEDEQWFRDEIWATAVKETDLDSGAIMAGVRRKAKMGRVDAARLAMEVSGRHDPKGDLHATQVQVHFGGIPRPEARAEIEGTVEEEADE